MRLPVAVVLASVLAAVSGASAATAAVPRPDVKAAAALVIDARTGETLFEEGAEGRHSIASATKLMTALLALERADPADVFEAVPYRALPIESKIGLRPGERMQVADLLEGLLLESANDAAVTLADGVSGSRRAFVRLMNTRARELGMFATSFENPIGFDDPRNYSTARDLAKLARVLLRNPRFRRIVNSERATLESGARPRVVENRNELVGRHAFVDGIKTGHTNRADYVLVGAAHGRGAQVVSVLLGAPTMAMRDSISLALLRFGIDQFRRVPVARANGRVARVDVEDRSEPARVVATEDVAVTVRRGERVRERLDLPEQLEGPIARGERVGTLTVRLRGRTVRRIPLVTAAAVPEPPIDRRIQDALETPLTALAAAVMVLAMLLGVLRARAPRARRT